MEMYTLKNSEITIQVASHGAELKSLKDNATGTEYMWCADEKYWKRTSPVLFPLVGNYKNGQTTYQGQIYQMSQHGFARDMEFTLVSQNEDSIFFALQENEETLKKYPFAFYLELGYRIFGRSVEVIWKVKNPAEETMYFSIGGHPAFNCPLQEGEEQSAYSLSFDVKDKIVSSLVGANGITDTKLEYPLQDGVLALSQELFVNDALVIENQQIHQVSLVNPAGENYLTVAFDAPLFGIWSPPGKNAPFVCIEPWYGRTDKESYTGGLEDREWGNKLQAGEEFEASYTVTIL